MTGLFARRRARWPRRPRFAAVPGQGQGKKFHSSFCWYDRDHVHPLCPPVIAERVACMICLPKLHKACRTKNARLHCALCAQRDREQEHWYQSRAEARTAQRLDAMVRKGEIVAWRRARSVVLQAAVGRQLAIRYTPDFVVTLPGGDVQAWEVKGSAYVIADDARLKIKLYRAMAATKGWPPLLVLNPSGQPIHV